MRKFVKIMLIIVLFLALIGGGTFYYFTKMKKYDVADEKVDEILEDPYSIAFPEGTPLPEGVQKDEQGLVIVDEEGRFVLNDGTVMSSDEWFSSPEYAKAVSGPAGNSEPGSAGNTSGSSNTASSAGSTSGSGGSNGSASASPNNSSTTGSAPAGNSTDASGGSSPSSPERVTAAVIKQRYASSFESLQGQVEGQLGGLIGQAKSEYAAKKAAGETINPAYFYQKYSGAATSVEAKTDSAFNSLYNAMKSELSANGLSTSTAEEYKQQYEAAKEARKSELLSKVTGG